MKKIVLIILLILLAIPGFFICRKYFFIRHDINDEYYIQQKPFTDNYVLKSKTNGTITEYIYEWTDKSDCIYGSGYGYYYIYDKNNNELFKYDENDQAQVEEFYKKIKRSGYVYRMDNCTRILDLTL